MMTELVASDKDDQDVGRRMGGEVGKRGRNVSSDDALRGAT